jgi:hypothetical protein
MSFNIISRPPNDSFTMRLFYNLTNRFKNNADCIYVWSATIDPNYVKKLGVNWERTEATLRELIRTSINKDLIILGIKDHLTVDFSSFKKPLMVEYLSDMFNFYQDKKFILFTSLENLQEYITNDNVTIIPWGGDLTNQQVEYQSLDPILDKNFDSPFSFISLNRNSRDHRILAMSIILGLGLETKGLMSFTDNKLSYDRIMPLLNFIDNKEIIENGFKKLQTYSFNLTDGQNIYANKANDNVGNFKNNLSTSYKDSFVEFVNETSCPEKCFLLTEKTLNSVYACNFPIWISSKGTVNFLREIGLDVFDDIIDHSYDEIDDPSLRIYHAINKNKNFLMNTDLIKIKWRECKSRFINNVNFVKHDMYDYYQKRAETQFLKIMKDYEKL